MIISRSLEAFAWRSFTTSSSTSSSTTMSRVVSTVVLHVVLLAADACSISSVSAWMEVASPDAAKTIFVVASDSIAISTTTS